VEWGNILWEWGKVLWGWVGLGQVGYVEVWSGGRSAATTDRGLDDVGSGGRVG